MLDLKTFATKVGSRLWGPKPLPNTGREQRLMVVALTLLLAALGLVFYWDRNFWFPDSPEAETQVQSNATPDSIQLQSPDLSQRKSSSPEQRKSLHSKPPSTKPPAPDTGSGHTSEPAADATSPITATATRTVLPPLEVEVVAGNERRSLPSANNSLHVDLQSGTPPQVPANSSPSTADTAASTTMPAGELVEMPADAPSVVSRSVEPNYPLLARQMKVQGAVVLQALISRDGQIQDLRVLSGPPILARAAQEAVRQWHFKPHYQGAEAVETQAKITVNFTISTN